MSLDYMLMELKALMEGRRESKGAISVCPVISFEDSPFARRVRFSHNKTGRSFEMEFDEAEMFARGKDFIDEILSRCDDLAPQPTRPGSSWGKNCPVPDRSRNSWNRPFKRSASSDHLPIEELARSTFNPLE